MISPQDLEYNKLRILLAHQQRISVGLSAMQNCIISTNIFDKEKAQELFIRISEVYFELCENCGLPGFDKEKVREEWDQNFEAIWHYYKSGGDESKMKSLDQTRGKF